jgi:hypothetical protein
LRIVILFHGDLAPYARIEEKTKEAKTKRMKKSQKKYIQKRAPRPVKKKAAKSMRTATGGAARP